VSQILASLFSQIIQTHIQWLSKSYLNLHGKNDFAEVSKSLAKYKSKNNFLDHQNNYSKLKHDE